MRVTWAYQAIHLGTCRCTLLGTAPCLGLQAHKPPLRYVRTPCFMRCVRYTGKLGADIELLCTHIGAKSHWCQG